MYDFFLDGSDNGEADRWAAVRASQAAPSLPQAARDGRAFMQRAVTWAALEGLTQFVDVGTGLPTEPTVHRLARQIHPRARVVGVDRDPVVVAGDRWRSGGMPIVAGDVRRVDELIAGLDAWIDWDEPVAVLLVAVLDALGDADDPGGVVSAFVERMVPGSVVALSHGCRSGVDADTVARVQAVSEQVGGPVVLRTRERIEGLFGRLALVAPGVVPVRHWPVGRGPLGPVPVLGGVGRVPDFHPSRFMATRRPGSG